MGITIQHGQAEQIYIWNDNTSNKMEEIWREK